MARFADYFIVVGYDQEKAGKFLAAGRLSGAEVCVQAVSQCVMMLMLDSFALSLATQLPGETGNTFCFYTNNPAR